MKRCFFFPLLLALFSCMARAQELPVVVRGQDGWLFLGAEIRHLQAGPFWAEHADKASQATASGSKDPEAALIDFSNSLKALGVELIFVPVPTKAAIMADKLPEGMTIGEGGAIQKTFYARLRDSGVNVLDLTDAFTFARQEKNAQVYCKQDAHWSPEGIAIAAKEIAKRIAQTGALPASQAQDEYSVDTTEIPLTGDLWALSTEPKEEKETLPIQIIKKGGVTPTSDESSPVLLLGDSHTLFLSAGGDMQAVGAGLPEHLAKELGMSIEVIGVKGSGAGPSRVNFARKAFSKSGWIQGKKVILYCLASRELTEATGVAWKKIPIKTR